LISRKYHRVQAGFEGGKGFLVNLRAKEAVKVTGKVDGEDWVGKGLDAKAGRGGQRGWFF
jgi:hypothetical protein